MVTTRDPVCGMVVTEDTGLAWSYKGQRWLFCSDSCRRFFQADPGRYLSRVVADILNPPASWRRIAYFSMEVATEPDMPTYSGGLGVLAGDTLRTCADLRLPVVAVSLLYKSGYFRQRLDEWGNQHEEPVRWDPTRFARLLAGSVKVCIAGHSVQVQAWQHDIVGVSGHRVPLFLLDTDVPQNSPPDRELTARLYQGDQRHRLAQEIVLGVGGIRLLRALGYTQLERFHMNEGHAALLVLELLNEPKTDWDFEDVRKRCVFTTHTPVPAGHDQFPYDLVHAVLTEPFTLETVRMLGGEDRLNMTRLALNTSHYVNGVAKKHGEVSRLMFAGYSIESITNGVHSFRWTCPSFRRLFDRHIPGWASDPFSLRYAVSIPRDEIWQAHVEAKDALLAEVQRRAGAVLSPGVLTIGFARRATAYKRADLVLSDPDKLMRVAQSAGPVQLLFAGKAHPQDRPGKDINAYL